MQYQDKTMMAEKQTYNSICFTDLAYEFAFPDKKDTEKKIMRRLKYHKLGVYNQERIDYIRQLKNDLFAEISARTGSKYFHKSKSKYADVSDFDYNRMASDFVKKYDQIDTDEMQGMIAFAIYLYYLR